MAIQGTDQERSAVTGAIGNEEGAPAPSFADVARKITGDDAPDWLVEALTNWGPCLMINRGLAVKQPTRSEMRKSLQAVRGAAACIVNALNNGATRDFLDAASGGKIPYHGQIDQYAARSFPALRRGDLTACDERR